jgi:hypothetical protein
MDLSPFNNSKKFFGILSLGGNLRQARVGKVWGS